MDLCDHYYTKKIKLIHQILYIVMSNAKTYISVLNPWLNYPKRTHLAERRVGNVSVSFLLKFLLEVYQSVGKKSFLLLNATLPQTIFFPGHVLLLQSNSRNCCTSEPHFGCCFFAVVHRLQACVCLVQRRIVSKSRRALTQTGVVCDRLAQPMFLIPMPGPLPWCKIGHH